MRIRDMDFGSLFKVAFWTHFAPILLLLGLAMIVVIILGLILVIAQPEGMTVMITEDWSDWSEGEAQLWLFPVVGLLGLFFYSILLGAGAALSAVIGAGVVRLYTALFMKMPPEPAALPPPI